VRFFNCILFAALADAQELRRLDGVNIAAAEAATIARKTLDAHGVTGAQIAVVNQGRLVWSYSHGLQRKNPDVPMTANSTLWAASITKGVFGAYVAQLVEKGGFALDAPVAVELGAPLDSFEPYRETGTEIVKDPRWLKLTPRHLLTHTSGLLNFPFLEPDKKMRLHFTPGDRYQYSGEGINLVQFLIERKKGRPLQELMDEALFRPLGMTATGLIYKKEWEDIAADRFDKDGKFRAKTRRFPARAAGSMSSSAEDLARFAIALMDGKILQSTKELFRPHPKIRTLHQFAIAANEPEGEEAKRVGLAYGLGWGLLTKTKFGPAFFKEGHGDGAQNYMICFPRSKSCMIVLTNSDNGELAFCELNEQIFGNTVTPWEWQGYTASYIEASRKLGN
jgi:CubicO group peptidase (beta-lactamase class C family)